MRKLNPGYVSGFEALTRIATIIAGQGVKIDRTNWPLSWFIAECDGQPYIQDQVMKQINRLNFIKISFLKNCYQVRKNDLLAICNVTEKFVPEVSLKQIENLLFEFGCLLTVRPVEMLPVVLTPVGQKQLSLMLKMICD